MLFKVFIQNEPRNPPQISFKWKNFRINCTVSSHMTTRWHYCQASQTEAHATLGFIVLEQNEQKQVRWKSCNDHMKYDTYTVYVVKPRPQVFERVVFHSQCTNTSQYVNITYKLNIFYYMFQYFSHIISVTNAFPQHRLSRFKITISIH